MRILTAITVLSAIICSLFAAIPLHAQATVTFDYPWATGGIGGATLYQDASGMSFRINPYPPQPHDDPVLVGAVQAGHPSNGTPHMEFVNTLGTDQFVVFALTNAASFGRSFTNGAPFGLISVDLADPVAPSLTPITITFNGYMADNTMVSQSFTVGGNGSSFFQTFNFNPSFAWGLTRVEMPSPYWAMDNLVFTTVPEPGTFAFSLLGVAALAWRFRRRVDATRFARK